MHTVADNSREKTNSSTLDDWAFSEKQLRFIQSFFNENLAAGLQVKSIKRIAMKKSTSHK